MMEYIKINAPIDRMPRIMAAVEEEMKKQSLDVRVRQNILDVADHGQNPVGDSDVRPFINVKNHDSQEVFQKPGFPSRMPLGEEREYIRAALNTLN